MKRKIHLHVFFVTGIAMLSTACLPRMTIDEIRAMQPPRPVELDRLEILLGDWVNEGEVSVAVLAEPMRSGGTNHAEWSLDRRTVVGHADLDMGPLGKMTGMSIWSWDPLIKKYRMKWFDSIGETLEAVITYNEATQIWHMKGKGQKFGIKTSGRGTMRRIDDDTLEWTWKEYDAFGIIQLAHMKGISRRK